MYAEKFIELVKKEKSDNWKNSDLPSNLEDMLEEIVEHLDRCEDCRSDFDAAEYSEKTLLQFSPRLEDTKIDDWICG